jgi:hypothetical protein
MGRPGSRRRATTCGCTSPGTRPTSTAATSPSSSRARAPTSGTTRAGVPRRAVRAVRRAGRPRPRRARRGRGEAGQGAGVLPAVVLRPPTGHRAGRAARVATRRATSTGCSSPPAAARRSRRVEAGQAVLQAHRQAHQAQGDQPVDRLPRHPAGGAVHHRHPVRERGVRAAGARRVQGAQHQLLPRPRARRRPQGVRRGPRTASRRPSSSRAPRPSPRCSSSRCRTPAAASRRRPATSSGCARSATSTTCCSSPTRSSAPSAASAMFAMPDFGYARHHHLRQGHDVGLRPHRRHDRQRPALRALPRHRPPSRTATPSAGTRSAAVALANLDLFEREGINDHVRANEGAFRATLEKLLDLPIVGDVRGEGYFYGIELVKDKATRRPSTTTSPSGCCAASCPRRCSRPACTAAPTTAATRSSSSAPPLIIDQSRVRRDRADPALHPCSPRRIRGLDLPVWAGVVPLSAVVHAPLPAPDLDPALPAPDYLHAVPLPGLHT